jgi:ectoine hydroxylase
MSQSYALTELQLQQYRDEGVIIFRKAISTNLLKKLQEAIDSLHQKESNDVESYATTGRWDVRNCLPQHPIFPTLLDNPFLLLVLKRILGWNIKLLGSQIVKMKEAFTGSELPISWHRDGGVLSAELLDPLPPLFVKVGYCISGSSAPDGGELLMVRGSHRIIGEPVVDLDTEQPLGSQRILMEPGDIVIFDWRIWHAVTPNESSTVRRTLYLAFGYRWLAAMDYQTMPAELLKDSTLRKQLLGGARDLGYYLPTESEVPLRTFS